MIAPKAVSRHDLRRVEVRRRGGRAARARTPCGSVASWRPKSTISCVERRRAPSASGSSPSSISSAAEEGRADQAVVLRSRSRGRTGSCAARPGTARPASCSGYHSQQRVERGRRVRQRPLHVGHAPARGGVRVGGGARRVGRGGVVERGDPGHGAGSFQSAGPPGSRPPAGRPGGRRGASRTARRGHRVGARAGRQAADVGAAQRAGAAERGRGQRLLGRSCPCRARRARGRTPSRSCSSSPGCSWWPPRRAAPASITRRASG